MWKFIRLLLFIHNKNSDMKIEHKVIEICGPKEDRLG